VWPSPDAGSPLSWARRAPRIEGRRAALHFVIFTHSLVSDWNHGNAHFLRGVMRELQQRGHAAVAYEPRDGWSRANLLRDHGEAAVRRFRARFPELRSEVYDRAGFDLDRVLDGADVVIVHEWNEPWLIETLSRHRLSSGRYVLLFHDTHHRAVTAPDEIERLDLDGFDGVLCFGEVIRRLYLERGWAARAWTWHEAADTALFRPRPEIAETGDLVWIGNWGDEERSRELRAFLLEPIRELGVTALIHGVRYPSDALAEIAAAGARYGGWLPNDAVPDLFAAHRLTVHVPRRPYVEALPGIPTIRMFEALACGLPLVSAPWHDSEGLFRSGDYLVARTGAEMKDLVHEVLEDRNLAAELAARGLETVRARHTCAHRVEELLAICADCGAPALTGEAAGPA
jgi:spore maturation protein CgeB